MFKSKPKSKKAQKKFPPSSTTEQASKIDIREKLAQKRKAKESRAKLFSLIGFSLFFAILIGLPLGLTGGIKQGVSIGIGIPILILCYNYPRQAMWAFLIYMPFSGTITYSIGGGNALFQLAKDAFYLPALAGFVHECRRKRLPLLIPQQILPTLSLLLFFSLLTLFFVNGIQQVALPDCGSLTNYESLLRDGSGNLLLDENGIVIRTPCKGNGIPFLQGLFGLKVLLGYFPLIFCTYYLIKDKKTLLFLGRLLVVLSIICCVLALIQYEMLKSGRCVGTRGLVGDDLFKAHLDARCLVGGALLYTPEQGVIRLPGTFVSPWHWAWFLVGNAAISFAVAFSETSFFWRLIGMASMALVFISAVVCGQRLAFGLVPVVIIVLLVLTGQLANLKRFLPLLGGVALLLFIGFSFLNPAFIQERLDSFVGRWNHSPPYVFLQDQFAFAQNNQKGLLGRGLGTGTNATRTFGGVTLIETFHPKLLFEIGYPGLIAFMIFVTHLSALTFKAYRSVQDKGLRSFASSLWVFMLIIGYFPYWYPLDTDPVAVYYWLFAGIIFKLPVIDKQEREKLKEIEENETNKNKKRIFKP